MADATYAIPSFHGGEVSNFAQGRFDRPDYRISLNICLNAFPTETGAWTRRPGSRHAGHTRYGSAGRVVKFDFEQASPYTLEFTDGFLRFRSGAALVTTNDDQVVVAVSAANPAVVQTTSAVTWATGDTLIFPGESTPLLENRQFIATKVDTTHFSLTDALTGATIDGATLGALTAGATVTRVNELMTAYVGSTWSNIRAVQAETTDILLAATIKPQALTVGTEPADGTFAQFTIAAAVFNDGPYLDPFTNGVQATPGGKTGIVTITLSFPAYVATTAYKIGDFVTSVGVNYISLVDQNVGSAPPSANWAATSASAAINDGLGFLGSDIGRLVRLFSEPAAWAAATAYAASTAAAPVIVSYNPTGEPGATLYYQAAVASTGKIPGTDLTNWTLVPQGAAIWTWGKITSLSNIIDRSLAGSASIGDMTSGGGLAAAFDGVFVQAAAASSEKIAVSSPMLGGASYSLSSYVGKNYSAAADQVIQQATVYPSSSAGLAFASSTGSPAASLTTKLNLRGKATAPASPSDGTLLGTSGTIGNTFSAVTVVSTNQVTAWKYVWVEQITTIIAGGSPVGFPSTYTLTNAIAELSLFNPPGTGTGQGINVQLLGQPLLYTVPITIWRLGVYSDTTGYPTCGTYEGGRIWLGGAIKNRLDACVSNGIDGGTLNFAPTNQYGVVAASNAISYVFNSDSVNPIYWMQPDLQGIIIGTEAGEWLVQAPTAGSISPLNISARRITRIGSANVEPRRTEHTNIFAQRYRRKLLEHFADAYSGKFTAPNLAERAEHITRAFVAELAYTSAVTPLIWGRCDDGALFGVTYKRDTMTTAQEPTFKAFHRHELGSDRTVESICSGPSPGGELDALTMVTNDATTNIRHVEVLTDMFDEEAALTDAWFLDNAVNPTSRSENAVTVDAPYGSLTLNGLWHLNGKTVQVFAGGLDCGEGEGGVIADFVVANGSVTVPFGDSISWGPGRGLFTREFAAALDLSQIVVGFTYDSDGQLVRMIAPADTGTRSGPGLGATRRPHQYSMLLCNSLGLSVGTTFEAADMMPVPLTKANGDPIDALTMYSGVVHDVLVADYSYDGMVCWRITRPWPANIVAISANSQAQDR